MYKVMLYHKYFQRNFMKFEKVIEKKIHIHTYQKKYHKNSIFWPKIIVMTTDITSLMSLFFLHC